MTEFWESSFRDKQEMWGSNPADAAITTSALFKKHGLHNILVPGFGYGRNAKVFVDNGFDVTGIEISKTAIDLAKKHYNNTVKIHHGSVNDMPFDSELYDGVFCYALIHLLNKEERTKLINNCYSQLKHGGYMVFVTLSKTDARYGQGEEINKDTFKTAHGVTLFFYDSETVNIDFENFGLIRVEEISEPIQNATNNFSQQFLQIICRK